MSSRIVDISVPPERGGMIRTGALVAVNTSGGKDSQAMTILLSRIEPHAQLVAVHAPLGEVDWHSGAYREPDAAECVAHSGPHHVREGLLESIEERGWFPDSSRRYWTSDHKRSPIERELRRLKAHPCFGGLMINAMGMRASESPARSKIRPWRRHYRNTRAGRKWFDRFPAHGLGTEDVFRIIGEAGRTPSCAYVAGMSRVTTTDRGDHRNVLDFI